MMGIDFLYPEFEVVRNLQRCTGCGLCVKQCANGAHRYDETDRRLLADESRCVNCQRCVAFCPARALKIVKSDQRFRENVNYGTPQAPAGLLGQAAHQCLPGDQSLHRPAPARTSSPSTASGAAPTRIRDNVGIPIELALAAVDQRLRDEGIRNQVSLIVGGSIRSFADVVKAAALGAISAPLHCWPWAVICAGPAIPAVIGALPPSGPTW